VAWIIAQRFNQQVQQPLAHPRKAAPGDKVAVLHHTSQQRAARRAEQRDVAIETVHRYNSDAIVLVGVPFGHTRPNGSSLTEAKSPSIAQRRNCGRTTPEAPSHVALGVSVLSSRSICGKRASECV